MSFDLEEYVPETVGEGDKLKPSDVVDHPLIIRVLDFKQNLTTKFSPNGDGQAVVVDVFDMSDETTHLGVMWFNAAIRDNLMNKVGKSMAVKLVYQEAKKGGNKYIVPSGLEGADLDAAKAWAKAKPRLFEEAREEREMGEYQSSTPNPGEQQSAFKVEKEESKPAASSSARMPGSASKPAQTPAPTELPDATDDNEEPPF